MIIPAGLVEAVGPEPPGPSDPAGDGTIGTISNDSNAANDPTVGGTRFFVAPVTAALAPYASAINS